jgi:L-ribulose-5-phosphate 4-epimerase
MHLESSENAEAFSPETQVAIARERDNVVALRSDLAARAPQRWTSATVSARVPNEALFVITPALAEGTAKAVILADFDGTAVPHTPGWDTEPPASVAAHAVVYRERASVGGVADLTDGDERIFGMGADASAAVDAVLHAAPSTPKTSRD